MKHIILPLLAAIVWLHTAQTAKAQYILKKADAQYELYNYIKAIDLYEKAYQKRQTLHAAERLYICNEMIRNYKEMESWAAIAAGMEKRGAQHILRYANALLQNAKYTEAKVQYENYIKLNPKVTAEQKEIWLLSCDSAKNWLRNPAKNISIKNESAANSVQSDWGTFQAGDTLIFASDRPHTLQNEESKPFLKFGRTSKPNKDVYGWTGQNYLRLYGFDKIQQQVFTFPIDAGTDYHVGPASFTANGKEMYFTLTRIPKKLKFVKGKLATINVEIFSSTKDNENNWTAPKPFPYNKPNEYSLGDPFISRDGKILYFTADMPNGKGGTDLYYCIKNNSGEWGKPVNIEELNSSGNERCPFIDEQNTFYFSSSGWIGMGGLDIFKAIQTNDNIRKPQNLGYPINSPQDDLGYTKLNALTPGYLSSNRIGGMGDDDIYLVENNKTVYKIVGTAFDKKTGKPLENAIISLSKKDGTALVVETTANGKFQFRADKNTDYKLIGDKSKFLADVKELNTKNLSDTYATLTQDLYLDSIIINKAIKLENIYYDLDKWNIRADAAAELDKLVEIMKNNPTIWIELGSHTDSRGKDKYNLWLSQMRADEAENYIISRGINSNRIFAKGYGEKKLVNDCTDGISCPEWMHQENRRTEFKVIKQ